MLYIDMNPQSLYTEKLKFTQITFERFTGNTLFAFMFFKMLFQFAWLQECFIANATMLKIFAGMPVK